MTSMAKKKYLHWSVIAWQLPLLLPFALLEFVLEILVTISWGIYCIADRARDSWLELYTRIRAVLPPMYSHHRF
jgi:hypothetical protein